LQKDKKPCRFIAVERQNGSLSATAHFSLAKARKKRTESHRANKSIAIFITPKIFNATKFKFYEFEGVTPRSLKF
jgi:hypothetical protein